jgi:S1-C subfamily serine protease
MNDASFRVLIGRAGASLADRHALRTNAQLLAEAPEGPCRVALPRADEEPPLTLAELYRARASGVVVVTTVYKCTKCPNWHPGSTAAGFVLTPDGVCVTNRHVLAETGDHSVLAVLCDGTALPITRVLATSEADDLAIFQTDTAGRPLAPIPLRAGAPVGTPVAVIAHPDTRYYTLSEGVISRRVFVHGGVNGDVARLKPRSLYDEPAPPGGAYAPVHASLLTPVITVTADFGVGSSGGPILDTRGNAVGMVASTHTVFSAGGSDHEREPQMTIRTCVPAESILNLCGAASR